MIATLTGPRVVAAIADLADVDPILVPQPRILHLVSSREIAGFLPPRLLSIPEAVGSQGAHLRANPALSLADLENRAQQVTRWLCQIAADAGLTSNCQDLGSRSLGCFRLGLLAGSFGELAVDEGGSGADEGDQVGYVVDVPRPRWEEYPICAGVAPEAVFTVRTYGDTRAHPTPGLVRKICSR